MDYFTSKKRFMLTQFPELLIDGITVERELVTKTIQSFGHIESPY